MADAYRPLGDQVQALDPVERWVCQENVARFEALLKSEAAPEKRSALLNMLSLEQKRLESLLRHRRNQIPLPQAANLTGGMKR